MPDDAALIHVMPEPLANKIAAGEVVQRPASALKELLENAVDAGASHVEVFLKNAGMDLIHVVDDGCGMGPDDAVLCFRRHATSKIREVDDLQRIATFGFRGEALASISAVARVELKTRRQQDAVGVRVTVEGGEEPRTEPCATPAGTSLALRNLFYNVPARRAFLKSRATELKHCVEAVQVLALAHPRVAFTLSHDGNVLHRLPTAEGESRHARLAQRIRDLFGEEQAGRLVAVDEEAGYLRITGFVARPQKGARRSDQFLFVNDRYVRDRYLAHAVRNAYGALLPEGAFPFFALTLHLDPARVDVNVHPTKAEVQFDDEHGVYASLREAVRRALSRSDLVPQFADAQPAKGLSAQGSTQGGGSTSASTPRPAKLGPRPSAGGSSSSNTPKPSAPRPSPPSRPAPRRAGTSPTSGFYDEEEILNRTKPKEDAPPQQDEADAPAPTGLLDAPRSDTDEGAAPPWLRQLGGRFLLTEARDGGLLVVDPRAAHERILYEQALQHLEGEQGSAQQLLFPYHVDLAAADYALVEELLDDLRALGFDLALLSGRSVAVRGVPADVRPGQERTILEDVLDGLRAGSGPKVPGREALAKALAVRGALREGARLSDEEARALLTRLFACRMPYAGPDGTPTFARLSLEELAARLSEG